mmetsp:Transcript_34930/g.53623  ORF Transcript_34930/g.53623 Transcript_34930/m.53623 type:complete len:104 (-) Transcript_34930:250-561(-)
MCHARKIPGDTCHDDRECEGASFCSTDSKRMQDKAYAAKLAKQKVSLRMPIDGGLFEYKDYNASKYGVCVKPAQQSDYKTLLGISVIVFAMVIISIAIYHLCS